MREPEEAGVLQHRSGPMSVNTGRRSAAPRRETALSFLSVHVPMEPGGSGSPLQRQKSYTGGQLLCS